MIPFYGDPIIGLQTPKSKYTNGRANRKKHLARNIYIRNLNKRMSAMFAYMLAIDVEIK